MSWNRALAVPLLTVAVLGLVLGYVITRQLAPQGSADAPRVSVIAMPSTPTPEPTEEPTEEPAPDGEDESTGSSSGRTRRGGSGGGSGNCPAGCTCESRPPAGVMIVCRGS